MTDYELLLQNLTKLRLSNIRLNLTRLLDSPELQNKSLTEILGVLTQFE